MEKEEAKASKELVGKYSVNLAYLKELGDFLRSVQEFLQYLGTNQYYSDTVNKKIFLLTLDADTALLQWGHLNVRASAFKAQLLQSALSKKSLVLEKQAVSSFGEDFKHLASQVSQLHERAVNLTNDIREEYRRKEHV